MFAAVSLIEQHDATIDEFADLTIDKAQFGQHFYLDKAPGMTLMAMPAVALADWWTGERASDLPKIAGGDFARYLRLRLRIAVAIGPAILTALAAVLILDMGAGLTGSTAAGLFAALGFALGTPAWGWTTTLLGHAPGAALYVLAIWAIWRGTRDGVGRARYPLIAGLALGWAVGIEYQLALGGSVIGLWGVYRFGRDGGNPVPGLSALVAGGLVALMPVGLYNIVAFGTPFRIGYSGVVGWEGMHQGLFGLGWPRPRALLEITVGPTRGLIWVAPILLLSPRGLTHWWHARGQRDYAVVLGGVALVVLLVNAAYVYWDGGNSTGPRLSIPMVGALALGLAPLWGGARYAAAQAGRRRAVGAVDQPQCRDRDGGYLRAADLPVSGFGRMCWLAVSGVASWLRWRRTGSAGRHGRACGSGCLSRCRWWRGLRGPHATLIPMTTA